MIKLNRLPKQFESKVEYYDWESKRLLLRREFTAFFCDWLISLIRMFSRFISAVTDGRISPF